MNTETSLKPTGYHWILFIVCFLSTLFGGVISTLMSVYLPVVVKDVLGNKSADELNYISAYINSVFILGGAAGGFLFGVIGDRLGRKKALIFSVACYGIFTLITGYMSGWWGIVCCRFFSGLGLGGMLVATTTIMIEEWPRKTRAVFMGILSIAMPIGIFSAGVIDYIVASWRQGFLVGVVPIVIALLAATVVKESDSWAENRTVVNNDDSISLWSPSNRAKLLTGSVIFGSMLIGLWAIFSWVPTWIQSLMPGVDAQKERGLSMMMLGMGGLVGGFISGWIANAIGLRRSLLACFIACALMSFLLFKTNSHFSAAIYAEIAVLALFFGASQGVLSVFIPGLFTVKIRATATGFCFNTGRVVTAFAVLFVGFLVSALGGYGNALLIFTLVFLIGLAVTFYAKSEPAEN